MVLSVARDANSKGIFHRAKVRDFPFGPEFFLETSVLSRGWGDDDDVINVNSKD